MDTIKNYKCPCCTAPLIFDAETQNLICESCDNTFSLETMQQMAEGDEKFRNTHLIVRQNTRRKFLIKLNKNII